MSASAWLHPALDIRRWRAARPWKQLACLPGCAWQFPLSPTWHLESGCPRILLALVEKRNCPPHQIRHLRLCSFLSLILRYCTSNILFGGENVPPPKSNLHPRLRLPKSRRVLGLLDPGLFLPSASGLLTQHSGSWSAVFSRPHPNFTTAPHYRPHSLLGLWCGALSDHSWK